MVVWNKFFLVVFCSFMLMICLMWRRANVSKLLKILKLLLIGWVYFSWVMGVWLIGLVVVLLVFGLLFMLGIFCLKLRCRGILCCLLCLINGYVISRRLYGFGLVM